MHLLITKHDDKAIPINVTATEDTIQEGRLQKLKKEARFYASKNKMADVTLSKTKWPILCNEIQKKCQLYVWENKMADYLDKKTYIYIE